MKKTIEIQKRKYIEARKKELAEINGQEETEIQEIKNDPDTSYSHDLAINDVWNRFGNERLELAIRCWERGLTDAEIMEIFDDTGIVEDSSEYAFPDEEE